jgi:hypothetical protein
MSRLTHLRHRGHTMACRALLDEIGLNLNAPDPSGDNVVLDLNLRRRCVPLVGRAARDIRRLSMPGTRLVQVDHATRNFRALMCMYSFDYAGIGHLLLRHCLSEAQQKSASLEVVRAVLSSGSSLAFVLSSGLQRSWAPAR